MSVIGSNILAGASGQQGYNISRSVRLRSSASASFSRTPAGASNQKTWTWSGWAKRGAIADGGIFSAGTSGTSYFNIRFQPDNISILSENPSLLIELRTTPLYRDPSAWYHIVFALDTTQATSTNRAKLYVNGVQVTAFNTATYPSLNVDMLVNSAVSHYNGRIANSAINFDGYLTEVNFIDGQALTPSSFGETNTTTGVWQPKKYTGTYGTNGFYLNFSNPSAATAAAIGADYSGNGNNWTPNNISVTAGVTYDSMLDVPTQWEDGGNGRGNYSTLNPLAEYGTIGQMGCTNGNLVSSPGGSTTNKGFLATIGINVGMLVYAEATFTTTSGDNNGGVALTPQGNPNPGDTATSMRWGDAGFIRTNNVGTAYGSALVTNDVVMMAVNYESATSCKVWLGKNGTWFASGNPATGANPGVTLNPAAVTMFIASYHFANLAVSNWTFGQRPFAYTPPTGFRALNTLNLPQPTILKGNQYFDVSLWTGNGTSQNIVNAGGFAPDLVWFKSRSSGALWNVLCDTVRGATKELYSNSTSAETIDITDLTAFNSNGFSVGSGNGANQSSGTYVGWQWRANGTPAVTNTAGSITSTVSAGATQGFSVVTYTGNGSSSATVGHGLGVVPAMVITKPRSASGDWFVAHTSLGNGNLILNQTLQSYNPATQFSGGGLATLNSSTTFGFAAGSGGVGNANANGTTYVAYCFAAVAGFSAFGSYTGNGSADGTFVYLGFRPEFVMVKRTDSANDWVILDTARSTFNVATSALFPNSASSETSNGFYNSDIVSNGFKIRATNAVVNASGGTYIYAAFSESPFKNALAR
jgi:hypothetical protein